MVLASLEIVQRTAIIAGAIVAVIAAGAAIGRILVGTRRTWMRWERRLASIDSAVNSKPVGNPKLYDMVETLGHKFDLEVVRNEDHRQRLHSITGRVQAVELIILRRGVPSDEESGR